MTIDLYVSRTCLFATGRDASDDHADRVKITYTNEGLPEGVHGGKLESGRWFRVEPDGSTGESDNVAGPYEMLTLDPSTNLIRCTPRNVTYCFPVNES